MARAARKALADMRALERQAERMNIVDPREVTTEELLGNGATPTMGLSQVRGGAECALDAEDCHDVNGTFFEGECYNAPASACSGKPSKPGAKCDYPEWHGRPAGTNFMYNIGDRVMYDGLAYEATSKNTVQPIRQPPDPLAYTISPYWKEVDCDSWAAKGGAECALDAEDCHDVNGTFFEGECYNAPAAACSGKPSKPGAKCAYPEWHGRPAGSNFMYNIGDRVMYDGLAYEATSKNTVWPIRQPPDPLAYTISPYWKEVECDSWAAAGGASADECSGSGRIVGGLAERSGNTMMSGSYRGLGAGSPAAMAMADVKSLKGGAGKTWFDKFVDGLIEKATKKVTELAEKAFNEYFDKLIEYGWNYAKEHGVNWIKENVFGDRVAKGVEQRLDNEKSEIERTRKREADEYRRRQHEDEGPSAPHTPTPPQTAAERKAAATAARDRTAAAKKAYEEARDKKRGAGEANELEGGYGNYGAYAGETAGGHCPSEEHLRAEVSGKGTKKGMVRKTARRAYEGVEGGKKRRAAPSANDGRRKRADIVKKVMVEKGLKMIEASKYVKAHNLY